MSREVLMEQAHQRMVSKATNNKKESAAEYQCSSRPCATNKLKTHRPQPYDRTNSPTFLRSSTGTPPSSPENDHDEASVQQHQQATNVAPSANKKHRRDLANKRERTRMHTVNSAFDHLRQLVPTYPSNRKLSKIETLRLACSYIQDLTKLINDNNIQAMHGEDVNMLTYHNSSEGFGGPYSSANSVPTTHPAAGYMNPSMVTKNEYTTPPEFTTQHQQGYCSYQQPSVGYVNSDAESSGPSEPDVPSPTHHYNMYVTSSSPGIAVRPPPVISRVCSDTPIIAMQMANASIGSSSPTYCGSPSAGAPCSPLTRVSSISHGQVTTLQYNSSSTPLSSVHQPSSFSNIHSTPIFPQCYSQ